jgi:tungstate transport system ATP-binding protein
MNSLISLHNLRLQINGRMLLDIPEFLLPKSCCTVLSGANGSGKTTLMKIIAGLQRPDACQIAWQHQAFMNWKKARPLLFRYIVYLHQQPFLFDTTVYNNVAYGLRHQHHHRAQRNRMVDEALQWVGLDGLADRHARRLSGGEKQRLALARAYVLQPAVLLMDEPTANMDQAARTQTFQLVQQLKGRGVSVMISSHELEQLGPLGDRHLHLYDSRVEADALPTPSRVDSGHLRLIK